MKEQTAKILLVQPSNDFGDEMKVYFKKIGFTVLYTTDFYNARREIYIFDADILITDVIINTKGLIIDGLILCENFRKTYPDKAIIILTEYKRNIYSKMAFEQGADMYIEKPTSLKRLVEIINVILLSNLKKGLSDEWKNKNN